MPISPSVPERSSPATLLVGAQSAMLASDLDGAKAQTRQAEALAEALGDRLMLARSVACWLGSCICATRWPMP